MDSPGFGPVPHTHVWGGCYYSEFWSSRSSSRVFASLVDALTELLKNSGSLCHGSNPREAATKAEALTNYLPLTRKRLFAAYFFTFSLVQKLPAFCSGR
jgi:hypothetical protein